MNPWSSIVKLTTLASTPEEPSNPSTRIGVVHEPPDIKVPLFLNHPFEIQRGSEPVGIVSSHPEGDSPVGVVGWFKDLI